MPNTTDDNATTWRDLADQLTPKQIAGLESSERKFVDGHIEDRPESQDALLGFARDYAEGNLIDAMFADVSLPAGARTDECGWEKNLKSGGWSRSLEWRLYESPARGVDVAIDGRQECEGGFTRAISLWAIYGADLTADQARAVAALLVEAAAALDALQ